ncbi:MAG: gephyrin-like molybdotransferase Glp [Pseudomonadota bacterium]
MISVEDAKRRIFAAFHPLPAETVGLADAAGRVTAVPIAARRTQPWADLSAMDGYAVRGDDVAAAPVTLDVIASVPAGTHFDGPVGPGQCVRIFTGAPLPEGTDTIVIQEDTEADGDRVTVNAATRQGVYVRPRGFDFSDGDELIPAGRLLTARDIGLAASMNHPWLKVHRRPRVAILATGDEIVMPGEPIGPDQIVSSNGPGLAALVEACGGVPVLLPVAQDNAASLHAAAAAARGMDLLITTGGASVGEHDLIREVLGRDGLEIDFWRIAMRPGKPLMFGAIDGVPVLGLPGNPVSSQVCALLFAVPALRLLQGLPAEDGVAEKARLGRDLPANDRRQDYLRSTLSVDDDGQLVATPFEKQDSSLLTLLAKADCLVVRPPHAHAIEAGCPVEIVRFDPQLARL